LNYTRVGWPSLLGGTAREFYSQ